METLDSFDIAILQQLQADGRMTNAELAQRVGLSAAPCWRRVRELERNGFITGYRAVVDLAKLGYGIHALIRVALADYAAVVKRLTDTPEVINAYNVTGDDSWILEIAVINVAHLDAVLTHFCVLSQTSTCIILNATRENAPVLPARSDHIRPLIHKVTGQ